MFSLKKQLIVWLIGLLTVVGLLASSISYLLVRESASAFFDHKLLLLAESVHTGSQLFAMQAKFSMASQEEQKTDFVIQVLNENENGTVRSSRADFDLPIGKATGYSDLSVRGEEWRVYTIVYPDRTVQVSQSDEVRRETAIDAALCTLLPIAVLLPLSWILIVIGVNRIFKPLADVSRAVTQRDALILTPLPTNNLPKEVGPLVAEINDLLLRIRESIELQRHFVSDAAHELRTPLTAIQLQIDNLSQSKSKDDLDARVDELRLGAQRASHIVGQLLKMAHFEVASETVRVQANLGEIVKNCIAGFIPIAQRRGIDLGMTHDETAYILASTDDLHTLFDNLLDNAVRYTQDGGQIDVSVEVLGKKAVVTIMDNGPGIPMALLPRVFDRFFRVGDNEIEGSGIGLAIVNAIVKRESAEIKLNNRQDTNGLSALVTFDISES